MTGIANICSCREISRRRKKRWKNNRMREWVELLFQSVNDGWDVNEAKKMLYNIPSCRVLNNFMSLDFKLFGNLRYVSGCAVCDIPEDHSTFFFVNKYPVFLKCLTLKIMALRSLETSVHAYVRHSVKSEETGSSAASLWELKMSHVCQFAWAVLTKGRFSTAFQNAPRTS